MRPKEESWRLNIISIPPAFVKPLFYRTEKTFTGARYAPFLLLFLPRGSKIEEEEKRRADAARHTTEQEKVREQEWNPSKVYFTDMRALPGTNLQQKLKRLILKAGIGQIDFQDKYAAIKIHFGEPGNLSYLRPNFAKTVADAVKELGGRPFLTDCNTLYVGRRKNALDHIEAAYENGFRHFPPAARSLLQTA